VSTVHLEADWLTLDNAAKIYPTASSKLFPTVFRLSAMLRAPVRLSALQQASDELLRRCPYFQVYLRRGLFWYYLQRHRDTPRVQLLDRSSLESLPAGGKTEHLLRIRARDRTIAVDFSHILTDGIFSIRRRNRIRKRPKTATAGTSTREGRGRRATPRPTTLPPTHPIRVTSGPSQAAYRLPRCSACAERRELP
jgi:hypothetical protein